MAQQTPTKQKLVKVRYLQSVAFEQGSADIGDVGEVYESEARRLQKAGHAAIIVEGSETEQAIDQRMREYR